MPSLPVPTGVLRLCAGKEEKDIVGVSVLV